MANLYSKEDCEKALQKLSLPWKVDKNATKMSVKVDTENFLDSLAFATEITVWAEALKHHPDLTLSYGKVFIVLTTHDIGGITIEDITLAKKIDTIMEYRKKRG